MRYLKDQDGNIFKANVISGIPEGFEDITDGLDLNGTESVPTNLIDAEFVDEVPAVDAAVEHWTDGETIVYDANDIPTLLDENSNPYLDPNFVHVPAVEATALIPAYYRLKKKTGADQAIRQVKMEVLLAPREALLKEADIEINKLEDASQDTGTWRTYRQALRDITEPYKKADGDWKVAVDSLETLDFPVKP